MVCFIQLNLPQRRTLISPFWALLHNQVFQNLITDCQSYFPLLKSHMLNCLKLGFYCEIKKIWPHSFFLLAKSSIKIASLLKYSLRLRVSGYQNIVTASNVHGFLPSPQGQDGVSQSKSSKQEATYGNHESKHWAEALRLCCRL